MNLKAKLEAVIYAAEEPVTLAQLTALFVDDALAWKAEQEAAAAESQSETDLEELTEPLLEGVESEEPAQEEAAAEESAPQESAEKQPAEQAPAAETEENSAVAETNEVPSESSEAPAEADEASAETTEATQEAAEASAESAVEELSEEEIAKREAKQREREAKTILRELLDELVKEYTSDERGVEIREIAGGYRMATKPSCHDAVRGFVKSLKPPMKLSLPALETLAVVAYKQPVTAPEVNEIRGVESSGVFGSLLARKLIATAGRKQVIGRPILYKTTKEFLLRFGLKDLSELPSMEEFEKMAASEFDEPEMDSASENQAPELDENVGEEQAAASSETVETEEADSSHETPAASTAEPSETTTEAQPTEPITAE